jgi:GNAT superfamily N-acetyltransferase
MSVAARHTVREARAADAAALEQVYRAVTRSADWLPAWARDVGPFASVSAGERVFVAPVGGGSAELKGLIAVYVPDAFIHHLYVAPPFQRQGVGSALLASLNGWLPRPWQLKCVQRNRRALAFYAALGWVAAGEGEGDQGPYRLLELR